MDCGGIVADDSFVRWSSAAPSPRGYKNDVVSSYNPLPSRPAASLTLPSSASSLGSCVALSLALVTCTSLLESLACALAAVQSDHSSTRLAWSKGVDRSRDASGGALQG